MSEDEAAIGRGPRWPGSADDPGPGQPGDAAVEVVAPGSRGPGRPMAGDPAALLLAVERVGADVTALGRALAAQPEEVAARLDVEAFSASVGLRLGALGSTLDQFRLSLLAALDRQAERVDGRLDELGTGIARIAEDPRLDDLGTGIARIAEDPRLDGLTRAVEAADPGERLARLEHVVNELRDGVRAGAAVGDALDHLGERLASIDDAAGRVAEDARILVERVSPVPDRLTAIASQVDRITPLARAGDRAGTLFDQLDSVGAGLAEVIARLRDRSAVDVDEAAVDERFDGVVDVLSGVTRRQDQVTAAIASVLDQVRGPAGVSAVLERTEQRERSLAARLDRIDGELRRLVADPTSSAQAMARPDAETSRALAEITALLDQQERVVGFRLDQIDAELRRVGEAYVEPDPEAARLLGSVLDRLQQQEATVGQHLGWVGERLSEVAAHLVPDGRSLAPVDGGIDDRLDAFVDLLGTVGRRQDEVADALAALREHDESPAALRPLADLARKQDELAESVSILVDQVRGPFAVEAVFDRMEQRERSLAARLDRIDGDLRKLAGGPAGAVAAVARSGAPTDGTASSLEASAETMATVAENLAALVESTTERLDRRLSDVEAALEARPPPVWVPPAGPPAPASASAHDAALRLAELRAERAQVQARLQEERLLAAQAWQDEHQP